MVKIKDAQKRGNQGEMKILAKQIVQLRKDKEKLQGMSSKLGTLKTQATMMQASHAMSTAMESTAKTMKQMNKATNPEKMQANMMDFQRQMAGMELNEEMLDDTLSSAFDDQVEDEADDIVRKTLEEIGVDATKALGPAPVGRVSRTAEADEEDAETERLMKQLLG
jgi:division protein CdvB (Snf7/Vps24/ESCRT-III family)